LKWGKGDFALITAHAKLGIINGGLGKGFSPPMKGMARGTLNDHLAKTMDLPRRIKGLASNREMWKRKVTTMLSIMFSKMSK
jgi:hypothetical protein